MRRLLFIKDHKRTARIGLVLKTCWYMYQSVALTEMAGRFANSKPPVPRILPSGRKGLADNEAFSRGGSVSRSCD